MPAGSIKADRDAAFAANLTSRLPDTPGDWLNTGVPQTVDAAFGTLAAGVATNSNSITAEVARSTAVDDAQSSQLAAQGKFYQTTAAAQADASLANGSVYQVPNTSTGQVDLYAKVSSSSSTFLMSLPGALQVNANTAAINTINEVKVATAFLTEPPGAADPWVDVWTTVTNPSTRWTTSIVAGALQITQTLASVLLRGLCRKDQQVAPGLWFYAEFVPATLDVNTGVNLLIAPDPAGQGTLDVTHGHAIAWRNSGGCILYRGDGVTSVVGAVPGGTPVIPYFAGQTVGLGLYVNPEVPTTGTVVQVINGQQVGSYQMSLLPTTGYVGATVRNAANPITATIKSFIFHPTVRKKRFVYVNASGGGSLGTESSPFTSIQQGLLASNEQPGEALELIIKGGVYRIPGGISIPTRRYRELTIRCPAAEKAKIYGSTGLAVGSSAWTKTAGGTNVWQNALPRTNVSAGVIDMSHTVDMGAVVDAQLGVSTTPRAGFIAPFHVYQILPSVGGSGGGLPTVATQIALCDGKPGTFFNDPGTGILYVHPIDNSDANSILWERTDAPYLLSVPWRNATDMNACRVNLAGLHLFGSYSSLVLLQRAWVDVENCIAEGSTGSGGFNTDVCYGTIASCVSQYHYGDCYHADPVDTVSVAQIPTTRLIDCVGRGGFWGGDGISNHELTNYYLQSCLFEYNGKGGIALGGEVRAHDCIARHNTQYAFSAVGMTVPLVRNNYLINCEFTDSPIGLFIGAQQAGDESHVYMRGGRIANTAGHVGASNRRVQIDGQQNRGLSSFVGLDVLDGGNNSPDGLGGPNLGSITWGHDAGYCA